MVDSQPAPARPIPVVPAFLLTTLLTIFAMLVSPVPVRGEPYIALREGYRCSVCHLNITGGGKRTDFANIYIQTRLPQYLLDWPAQQGAAGEESSRSAMLYNGRINEFLSLGGDLRVEGTYSETPNDAPVRTFAIAKGLLYLEMDFIPDKALFYLDQELSGTASTREFFMLLKGTAVDLYAKVGRFFLPSGLRLQDDTAFVRSITRFNYGVADTGVELGVEPGPFSFSVAVTNGATLEHKKVSAYGYGLWRYGMFGMSRSQEHDTATNVRHVSNVFGGVHLGRFTGLGEVDRIVDASTGLEQQTALFELNVLITKGANLKLTYEWYKPNVDVDELNQDRLSLVYEPFVTQFLQVRVGARDRKGPKNDPAVNSNLYFLELHAFF